jgi:transcriptional regulator with XRE-family HTH domain
VLKTAADAAICNLHIVKVTHRERDILILEIHFPHGTNVPRHGTNFPLPEVAALVTMTHPEMLPTMNIGETIRNYRLQKGMSQGDIEKRTGLLRCYLSRVENGHTIPSLDTLSKIAGAMELPLSQFFSDPNHSNGSKGLPQLSDDEVRFLSQIRRYSTSLNDSDRKLVLAMVKKMASNSAK